VTLAVRLHICSLRRSDAAKTNPFDTPAMSSYDYLRGSLPAVNAPVTVWYEKFVHTEAARRCED
jgi:hypothetical protein